MNPNRTQTSGNNKPNLFEGIESWNEFEQAEPDNTKVIHSTEAKQAIREGWDSFYRLRTETKTGTLNESPVSRGEVGGTVTLTESSSDINIANFLEPGLKPIFVIENAKGSGSSLEEAGLKIDFPALGKEIGKGLFGALGLFKEIFLDTITLVFGKKDKKIEKPETDPEKAKANAEKKAEKQRKQNNIRAFYEGLRAQAASVFSVESARMETQEKANINLTAKIGQESYKGIKDSFGRLTVYAASMFEKARLDEEKKTKKHEKEQKIAAVNRKGPDLSLDKVAEGGFLSSTGGQGAG